MVGIGCLSSPLVADFFTSMENPITLQRACIAGMALAACGCLGMGLSPAFWSVCFFTLIRSAGDSLTWIDSTLLLQTYSEPEMLGRVTSVEYALAYLTEASGAYLCGILEDNLGLTGKNVSMVLACVGAFVTFVWLSYHLAGRGAANKSFKLQLAIQEEKRNDIATEHSSLISAEKGEHGGI